MKALSKVLAGGIGLAALTAAAPAAAQYYPGYGYGGYGQGGGIGVIIDQILGGDRYAYGVDNRALVNRCIAAVTTRIQRDYAYSRYGYPYGYGAYGAYGYAGSNARVLGITDIDRRSRDIRVRGVATAHAQAGAYGNPYGNRYAYGYGRPAGELRFECNVDYRGYIRDIDVDRR